VQLQVRERVCHVRSSSGNAFCGGAPDSIVSGDFSLDGSAGARHTTRPSACAQVAQSAEQGTENPRVGGSIPPLGTSNTLQSHRKPWQRESAQYSDRASAYRNTRDFSIVVLR
jgi:hypothetical protein